jgi:hypothetical protein
MAHPHAVMILCGVSLLAVSAGCEDRSARPEIDPRAEKVLREMSDALGAATTFSFHAEGSTDEVLEDGRIAQFCRRSEISVRRPDRLFVDTKGDDLTRSAWYDGKSLVVLAKEDGLYASIEVRGGIEDMLDLVIEKYGLTIPVADFLFRNSYESLTADVQSGEYLGEYPLGERMCHHLAFRAEQIDWQIWIDAGETPLPRRLVITYKQDDTHPHCSLAMDNWDLSAKIPDGVFEFRSSEGAEQVEMDELLGMEAGE